MSQIKGMYQIAIQINFLFTENYEQYEGIYLVIGFRDKLLTILYKIEYCNTIVNCPSMEMAMAAVLNDNFIAQMKEILTCTKE